MKLILKLTLVWLLTGTQALQCDRLDTLGAALKTMGVSQPQITETGLLGPWILEHHPKKLVASNENFNNQGIKVYQIKVRKQWEDDCWIHAFRNSIYVMDLALSPRKDFDQIYTNMKARDQYEAFTQHGCPKKGTISPVFIQQQLDCIPHCIPKNSLAYLEKTLYFEYGSPFNNTKLQSIGKLLTSLEKSQPTEQIISDYALLSDPFNIQPENINRLITLIHGLQHNKDYCCGISLGIKSMEHDVMLVINKSNGVYEYLFADSNNMSFAGNNYTWQKGNTLFTQAMSRQEYQKDVATFTTAIKQIVYLVNNPNHFNDMMVRILYAQTMGNYMLQKDYNIKQSGVENWKKLADFSVELLEEFHAALSKYNLLNNKLYTSTYKEIYCNATQKELSEQNDKKNVYAKLLQKISC